MATPTTMTDLSITAASNSPAGSESPTNGDDFLRAIQAIIRRTNAKGSDIASATTTDIGAATAEFIDITGTTTITGLGTIDAGIVRTVRFTGALTLTYNATSLILPGNANITTANGDMAMFRSLGSGNWVCVSYVRRNGNSIVESLPLTGGTITGDVTFSGATLKLVKGADVASAAALPLITDGNYFDVTGTTTITSFASMGVGTQIALHFDSALTLTHNATDLILPGGANITTAAGDEAEFIEYSSGDWRCVSYTRAAGLTSSKSYKTAIATTSGTTHSFDSLPANIKSATLVFKGVSLAVTSDLLVQLSVGGSYITTGYISTGNRATNANVTGGANSTAGFLINYTSAAQTFTGEMNIRNITGNDWVATHTGKLATDIVNFGSGDVTLSGTLDGVRLTSVTGQTFDAGSINLFLEIN